MRVLANLAYYRTGWCNHERLFTGEPYRTFNANCYDHIYMDWCKLFGSDNELHHWRNFVTNPDHFRAGMFEALGCDDVAYREFWEQMLAVRNRAIAHQDIFDKIPAPMFDKALQTVGYLLNYIYENEVGPGIIITHQYDPVETYERFHRWGAAFWNGEEPAPEDGYLMTLRTVKFD